MSRFAIGIVCALMGAVCWGFSGTCAQYLFTHYEISPFFITVARTLGAGALFCIVIAARYRAELSAMLRDGPTLARIALFGGAGVYGAQITYLACIDATNAGTATVLQALSAVFVLAAVCLSARRLPRFAEAGAVALALVAVALIATKGDFGTLQVPLGGLVAGILSAGAAAFYVAYPRRLFERWGSMPVTGLGMLAGGILAAAVFFGAAALWQMSAGQMGIALAVPALGADGIVVLALMVLVGTFASFSLYLYGVSIIGGVKGSLLGTAEPLSASVFALVWMGTMFTCADWVGMALMIAMVFIVSLQKK